MTFVRLDNDPTNRQPDSQSALLRRHKWLEQSLADFVWQAGAVVRHPHFYHLT